MNARRAVRIGAWILLCSLPAVAPAQTFDIWRTGQDVPANAGGTLMGNCVFGPVQSPLTLQEAVGRALCHNPKTREAWADIKSRAAATGAAHAAFLPSVTGSWQTVRDDAATDVSGQPGLDTGSRAQVHTESVSLSWVLYDFGGRRAALHQATALLSAAQANHNDVLQTVFASAAKDYYAGQAAQGSLGAADALQDLAHTNVEAVAARVQKGVAPVSDLLQAKTSYAQAVSGRIRAAGELQAARGNLAVDMSLDADALLTLPDVGEGVLPGPEFDASVHDLMEQARRDYPSVQAAQAQLDAAIAQEQQTRAEGLPNLGLIAKYLHNNQPINSEGLPPYAARAHDWYIGVQLTIPFFEGFGRSYQIQQARAQIEHQRDALDEAQQKVGLDVWLAWQTLQSATQSVTNSAALLEIARQSYQASHERYVAGVGTVLELLNTQSAQANAEQQRVQALTDWRNARLQLAAKLGRLNMWTLASP